MAEFAEFLETVLTDGRIVLSLAPGEKDDPFASEILARAYATQALSLAGPMLPMDDGVALAAGRVLHWSAWCFVNPGLALEAPERRLLMPMQPMSPAQHLSADLCLRYLPILLRRARANVQDEMLPRMLRQTLRDWPLSGVLSDIAEPPSSPIGFGTHPGVNFLYAERLLKHTRSGWIPDGIAREYAELVWREHGQDTSLLGSGSRQTSEI